MPRCRIAPHLLGWLLVAGASRGEGPPAMIDLTSAVVVAPADLSGPERKAVRMLVEEMEARSGVAWPTSTAWPAEPGAVVIAVGREPTLRKARPGLDAWLGRNPAPAGAEGFRVGSEGDGRSVLVVGNDPRGVLFGVGRLLRELRIGRGRVTLPAGFRVATAPRMAIRGHQLGYRPKTNAYDAWDLDRWERYIRDLAVFGTNAIELVPPRTDDDDDSPHFPRPPMEMMAGMSRLADEYGLDVSIWYPAMEKDYDDPAVVDRSIKEWADVFRRLPRVDAVFVPGGDPGHTRPRTLMALLEKQAGSLRRHHPRATLWVSPQGFDKDWLDEFLATLRAEPAWLGGVVFGPQVRVGLAELRAGVPARYPIRNYPDITHTINCQYPVPDWDLALSLTHDREPINPRPLDQAAIVRACLGSSIGFISYSEGCNDDVNKFVWSGLGWDPDVPVVELLRQYGRTFVGDRQADPFAQGLLALERNWRGPLLTNAGVEDTLRQFQDLERSGGPRLRLNWRFQQALYRATYDAYVRDRLIAETARQSSATDALRAARRVGSLPAIDRAVATLAEADARPDSPERRARVGELAEALFQSIGMQLSVEKHGGMEGRGTTLDSVDAPLNDRAWLLEQFASIRKLDREPDRLDAIDSVLNRTDPGPGGFYDDLGDPSRQPHLVRGPGYPSDPDFRRSAYVGFHDRAGLPRPWAANAQSLYDAPLRMHYDGLDPSATYRLRVVYGGDNFRVRVRLDADGIAIHNPLVKPDPPRPLDFPIPPAATADGALTLRWARDPGLGGNGRGCQVAEVWLIREPD